MTRFFYILLVVLGMSCSGNKPLLYNLKPVGNNSYNSFNIEYGTMPHDSFPMHYSVEKDTSVSLNEFSYSIIRNYGDTLVWEEGMIRE